MGQYLVSSYLYQRLSVPSIRDHLLESLYLLLVPPELHRIDTRLSAMNLFEHLKVLLELLSLLILSIDVI